jgi:UDP-2-acetamido-2,6-beta-L-arabino-hexul-4-ose reductase
MLEIDLFNTFRYFDSLESGIAIFDIVNHTDERGGLCEVIKSQGKGQIFYSSSKKGVTRGNHYHTRKVERFCIVDGQGLILIENLFTGKSYKIEVAGTKPMAVDIPTCHIHSLKNTGSKELLAVFWVNEFFDAFDSDTYYINK